MSEDLIRLEQKLDLIIYALQEKGIMHKELPQLDGIEQDICALCNQQIRLIVNPSEGTLIRACGCKLPKQAYKLEIVNQPIKEADNANHRANEIEIPSDRTE